MHHASITDTGFSSEVSASSIAGRHAIHQFLVPFPVAYFTAAFVTDIAYWRTAEVMWERFSVWLIAGGLVLSLLAAIAAVIDLAAGRQRPAWARASAYTLAVLLSVINVLVHSRDGYTAIVPTGLTLSAVVTIIMLATASTGWALTHPRLAGAGQ